MRANKEILVLIIGVLILYCLYGTKQKKELERFNFDLRASNKRTDSLHVYQSERLLYYSIISIKQNEIINRFSSSRKAKLEDAELMELQTKLN
jgi:hypothetical protein